MASNTTYIQALAATGAIGDLRSDYYRAPHGSPWAQAARLASAEWHVKFLRERVDVAEADGSWDAPGRRRLSEACDHRDALRRARDQRASQQQGTAPPGQARVGR